MPDEAPAAHGPTLADVLAAIAAARADASHRADRIEARLDRVDAAIGQVRADVAVWAHRHDGDPGAHRRAAWGPGGGAVVVRRGRHRDRIRVL